MVEIIAYVGVDDKDGFLYSISFSFTFMGSIHPNPFQMVSESYMASSSHRVTSLPHLSCSITSQSNALGQDTSNSDSIAVGDDYDFSFAGGEGNGSPGSGNMITVDYISTNGDI